jgi:serine/threonine protein kinase
VLALEHLGGGMLLDRLKKGPMKEAHAAAAFHQILSCILFMHHDGYLHRDLKPDNVMLAAPWCPEADAEAPPPVRLIDLGMVLKYVDAPNETGLMGSPGYMSPEAIRCAPTMLSTA